MRRQALLFVFPVLLCILGIALDQIDPLNGFRVKISGHHVPEYLIKSGKAGGELRLLEHANKTKFKLAEFENDLAPIELPSSKNLIEIAQASRLPTLSITVDSESLNDKFTGLLNQPTERGRSWERSGYVSYFDDGNLVFASGIGLRIHGGKSRGMLQKSFRVYFRSLYNSEAIPSSMVFGEGDETLRSLIVHNDRRENRQQLWHFTNPLAYEIANEIGCETPYTQPAEFYLNGEYQGVYVLTEHLSAAYLNNHFGHDNFVLAETKLDEPGVIEPVRFGSRLKFEELTQWALTTPKPMNLKDATQRVDLSNLTNWIISIVYAGVTDPFQGIALLDESRPDARWFWINWDMDHAFSERYYQTDNAWEIDSFGGISGVLKYKRKSRLRATLFRRLMEESAEYRLYFLTRLTLLLNHVLTPKKVYPKIAYYEQIAISHGIVELDHFESIRQYVTRRPTSLRAYLAKYFGSGESYRLQVRNLSSAKIKIDGFAVGIDYVGEYFVETPALIEIPELVLNKIEIVRSDNKDGSFDLINQNFQLTSDIELIIRPTNS